MSLCGHCGDKAAGARVCMVCEGQLCETCVRDSRIEQCYQCRYPLRCARLCCGSAFRTSSRQLFCLSCGPPCQHCAERLCVSCNKLLVAEDHAAPGPHCAACDMERKRLAVDFLDAFTVLAARLNNNASPWPPTQHSEDELLSTPVRDFFKPRRGK